MAIKLMKVNNSFNIQIQHFYIDDLSDLDSIESEHECQMGDIAELPDGAKYRRHSDDYSGNLWEYYTGGGGSTDGYDVMFRYSCDWDNSLGYINWTAELVSGSFEAAQAKAASGQPVQFSSVLYLPQENDIRDYTMTAFGAPRGYYTDAVAEPLTGTFVLRDYFPTDRAEPGITVEWSSDGTIIVTLD